MKAVHCLGVAVMDALSGPIDRYPEPRRRPQVNTENVRLQPGGGAVNTACALARMGLPAALFARVGCDLLGDALLEGLRQEGVDVSGVCRTEGDSTPFTFVGVHPGGERTFIHTPGANLSLCPDDLDLNRLVSADFLLYQDLFVLPSLDPRAGEILAEARRRGAATLLDECWGLGPDRQTLERLMPYCDYVMPSLDDMRGLYPGAEPCEIAARLHEAGAGTVVVKMGAEGCLVSVGGECVQVGALPACVVDATGAGDCWNAGFIAGLMQDLDAFAATDLGCACAAFCIEAVGGSTGVPPLAEVQQRSRRR
jgi:sugar/nucleoside kinase (ribokinase family)